MKTEQQLEKKYQPVLAYTEAKQLIKMDGLTAGKIRGAITRFQKVENLDRPRNFTEQESFAIEMLDWWQDANPEVFDLHSEDKVEEALNKYLAHVSTWKAKFKDNNILIGEHVATAGSMLVIKNTAGAGIKMIGSMAKRKPEISAGEIKDGMITGFAALLPYVHALQIGEAELPEGTTLDDVARLVGAFLVGDKSVVEVANNLKQLADPRKENGDDDPEEATA